MTNRSTFKPRENTGVLFYDAPGVPTMRGNILSGKKIDIQAEPATDKNQVEYSRITGDEINGALYVNDRKTEDRHPDFTGPITVKGREMRVAAWKKEVKTGENKGSEYLSLSLSEKRENNSN